MTHYASIRHTFTEKQLIEIEAALANMVTRAEQAEQMIPGGLMRPLGYKWERVAIQRLQSAIQSELAIIAERQEERVRQCANCPHRAEEHRIAVLVSAMIRTSCMECACGRFGAVE